MKKRTLFAAVTNDISTDYRVHKFCAYLTKKNFDITVYGRVLPNTFLVDRAYKTIRKQHFFNHHFLFYAEYNLRLFFYLLFKRYDYILANDLDTLPACFLISRIKGINLVYDSHELFTEVPELEGRWFVKRFWRAIESFILPKLDSAYTVSKSIADYYYQTYGVHMGVVRNLPLLNEQVSERAAQFPTKNKVILYQGVLNPGRGIEEVIKALHFLREVDLVIIGYGKVEHELKSFVRKEQLEERVHFLGRVAREELPNYTKKASVGMVLEQPLGLSFQYALPNKLFDFIHAEVPIITSDLIEIKRIVDTYKIGVSTSETDPKQLAKQIQNLITNADLRMKIIENQQKAKHELCWEKESEQLELYFK